MYRESVQKEKTPFRIIAVTNRHLSAGDYFERIGRIASSGADAVIVREKDMTEEEYLPLARRVLKICEAHGTECVLHNFVNAASELGCRKIHLPLSVLRELNCDTGRREEDRGKAVAPGKPEGRTGILSLFDIVGASVHSRGEAEEAERLGADYITAGHIFATDCKKGAEPRGTDFLTEIVSAVSIPVYGIGGISRANIRFVKDAGAAGACIMSQMMKGDFYEKGGIL